jgi:hypothetical protein
MTMKFKLIFKERFSDFLFFYSYLDKRIFISLILSFSVGLMDGLGLAMFIPLLQLVEGGGEYDGKFRRWWKSRLFYPGF